MRLSLLFKGYRCFLPEVKQPKLKVDYLHSCSVKAKNEWSCTRTPHMHNNACNLVFYNDPVI
jgi:hypothetical protein